MSIMKKALFTVIALSAMILPSCGESTEGSKEVSAAPVKKSAAVYFSRVGNTDFPSDTDAVSSASLNIVNGTLKGNAQLIAEWAADEAGCDVFEIAAEKSYPVDYDATVDQAKAEQGDNVRPSLKSSFKLDDCDTVWLSFPNWWADLPMPVYTFFDEYDLSGKNIFVFVTHEGSGFSSTVQKIRELEPDANVIEALAVRGGSVPDKEQEIRDYIKQQLN